MTKVYRYGTCLDCQVPILRRQGRCAPCEYAARATRHGPMEDRFWSHVDKSAGPDGCWLWTGARASFGYGIYNPSRGFRMRAHRAAYTFLVGQVPDGLTLDHLCRNRLCVNPTHLEPVTNRENVLRGEGHGAVNARKTHCIHGHNEWRVISKPRYMRRCLACLRISNDRRRSLRDSVVATTPVPSALSRGRVPLVATAEPRERLSAPARTP